MKAQLKVFLLSWCMTCVAIEPLSAQESPVFEGPQTEIDAIRRLLTQWGERRDAADIDGVVELHDPDVLIMTRDRSVIKGRSGARSFYQENYDTGSTRQQYGALQEIRVFGNLGIMVGRFLVVDTKKGIEDPGYYLIVLRKNDDGDWRIYRDIDTPSPDGLALKPGN